MVRALLLFMALRLAGPAAAQESARLAEVKVWYYPPAGGTALVKHWAGGQLKVDRRYSYSRLGKFRVRVQFKSPGKSQYLSIRFKDQNGTTFDLPGGGRKVEGGVKDMYWMVPYNFLTGPAELQVSSFAQDPAKASPVDKTPVMVLGTVTAR
ncbi:MAG: hypothetical protein AB1758_11845 [Candidatus Eremiobacterota bacterium]